MWNKSCTSCGINSMNLFLLTKNRWAIKIITLYYNNAYFIIRKNRFYVLDMFLIFKRKFDLHLSTKSAERVMLPDQKYGKNMFCLDHNIINPISCTKRMQLFNFNNG